MAYALRRMRHIFQIRAFRFRIPRYRHKLAPSLESKELMITLRLHDQNIASLLTGCVQYVDETKIVDIFRLAITGISKFAPELNVTP